MGLLAGKTKLRRIVRWCRSHLEELQKYMPFPNGIPSLATMSRILAAVDGEMVSLALINWTGEIFSTKGIHIAIDGKGLRAAAHKVRDERTPYIINAVDTVSRLVIAQLSIGEKTNEAATIPALMDLIGIDGSVVTIDAAGATENIMEAVCNNGGDFVLQVKKNCPALHQELMTLFDGLAAEQGADEKAFHSKYGASYSEVKTFEKNRERYEYRECQSYSDADGMKALREERPHIACVGRSKQVRILQVQDSMGNDITPGLEDFLKEGSRKQPKPVSADSLDDDIQMAGLISSRVLSAEELMKYKRKHWEVENGLHYVLDEVFGEDKSTIRKGKNTMSVLRKCAYNIARLLQMETSFGREYIPDVIDDVCDNLELGFRKIFQPVPSCY